MEILLLLFGAAALVWLAICYRYFGPKLSVFHPIPLLGFLVILTGSVVSNEFWSLRMGPLPITIDRLLVGALGGLFLLRFLNQKENLRSINHFDIACMILISVLTFSTVTHDMTFLDNMPLSRLLFFNLMPLVVYAIVRTGSIGTKDLKLIALGVSGLAIYLAFTAIAETRGWHGLVFPRYIMTSEMKEFLGRGRGPFLNPVSNGIFMIAGICCTLMWWPQVGKQGKIWIGLVSLFLAVGVYCTLTRSVWLSLVLALGWLVFYPSTPRIKAGLAIAGGLGLIMLLPVIGDKLFSFKRDKEVTQTQMEISAQMRPMFAIVAMNMFEDRPIFGCGFGQYAAEKDPYLKDAHANMPLTITKSLMQHNVFLAYLTETGLIGLSALLLWLTVMSKTALAAFGRKSLPLWPRQFGLLLLAVLTCHVVNGLFHDTSIIPMQHMLLYFLAGLVNNIVSGSYQFEAESDALPQAPGTGLQYVDSQQQVGYGMSHHAVP